MAAMLPASVPIGVAGTVKIPSRQYLSLVGQHLSEYPLLLAAEHSGSPSADSSGQVRSASDDG